MKVLRLNSNSFPMTVEERREYEHASAEVSCRETLNESQDDGLLQETEGLGIVSAKVGRSLISRLTNCKVISRYGNGTDNIDVSHATSCGIIVTNVPHFCLSEVADHTIALLLGLARKLLIMDRSTRTGEWQARVNQPVRRISGKVLGLVGFGRIAREIARRATAFDLRIVAADTRLDLEACARVGANPVSLAELLEVSDFISLHVPLIPDTFHLIGESELRRMKASAFLINTARGAVIDESALVKALKEGWISGAGLDVYEGLAMFDAHPQIPDHPLFKMQNVILTPHSAGVSVESLEDLCHQGARHVVAVLKGTWPPHCVNPQVIPRISLVRTVA